MAAARQLAAQRGVSLPDDLRIWSLASKETLPPRDGRGQDTDTGESARARPATLPHVLEAATSTDTKRTNGLYVTPDRLADELVGLALHESTRTICDPACGGGAFLLAAARALHARGVARRDVVQRCLWGADIDPVGLATAEVALTLWAGVKPAGGRLIVGDALIQDARIWSDAPAAGFDAVVGNPPFLNQLSTATARSGHQRALVRQRFGAAVQAYSDAAWLFLLAGCELVRPGGRVALVQPLSLVAARDAAAIRAGLDTRAELCHLWVPERPGFTANVRVCCPVLQTRGSVNAEPVVGSATADGLSVGAESRNPAGGAGWADRLADAIGVPRVVVRQVGRLADRAKVTAGFRDEYYGLVPLVCEATDGAAPSAPSYERGEECGDDLRGVGPAVVRPLVTAGVLDWGRSAWGQRPSRFARRRWTAPVVDPTRAHVSWPNGKVEAKAARWLARTAAPKVVVATQTPVVEAAVDVSGAWVPSVPALAVLPHRPADVWLLAAAIASPTATAWLLRRAPGTALATGALRIAARDLAALPLPTNQRAWRTAAEAFRAYAAPSAPTDEELTATAASTAFEAYCAAIAQAYDVPRQIEGWWRERVLTSALPETGF